MARTIATVILLLLSVGSAQGVRTTTALGVRVGNIMKRAMLQDVVQTTLPWPKKGEEGFAVHGGDRTVRKAVKNRKGGKKGRRLKGGKKGNEAKGYEDPQGPLPADYAPLPGPSPANDPVALAEPLPSGSPQPELVPPPSLPESVTEPPQAVTARPMMSPDNEGTDDTSPQPPPSLPEPVTEPPQAVPALPMPSPNNEETIDTSPQPTPLMTDDGSFDETDGSVDGGGLESTCPEQSQENSNVGITTAKYEYLAIVKEGANVTDVLLKVENGTHVALVDELLDCVASRRLQNLDFKYLSVKSDPMDIANTEKSCQNVPDGQDCWVIDGGATFEYLSTSNDGQESAVLDQVGAILKEQYDEREVLVDASTGEMIHPDLLGLDFVAFTGDDSSFGNDTTAEDSPGNGDTPAGLASGDESRSASPSTVVGVSAVAIAAVGLIVVGALIFRRRHSDPRSIYLQDVQADKDIPLDEDDDVTSPSSQADPDSAPKAVVLNDELDDESTYVLDITYDLDYYEQDIPHDPETCHSLSCPICGERALVESPVFVSTEMSSDAFQDLSPRERLSSSERGYALSPDTVEL